jgi:membrane-bound metal-dependent hydrolase YbcI (DUF457 family)
MFIGHFGVAFAAKRAAPAVSLGTLILACQLADLIWPTLVLLGIEHVSILPGITVVTPLFFESYPYSHSLLMLSVWAGIAALIYRLARGSATTAALFVIAGVVISHWFLDVVTHRADVPFVPGDAPKVGLGLWNSLPATLVVEAVMLVGGLMLYLRMTKARDRVGTYALWGLVVFLIVVNVANMFGPPPPSVGAVAWAAQAIWLIVAWGYWIDRHRVVRSIA